MSYESSAFILQINAISAHLCDYTNNCPGRDFRDHDSLQAPHEQKSKRTIQHLQSHLVDRLNGWIHQRLRDVMVNIQVSVKL